MRELFPGFYKRANKEISDFWKEGIFVFDTNMLLNVYRYAPETRDRYFEILDILKKRSQFWVPYQAAYEYQDRRIDVIRGQLEPYTKVGNILQTTWQTLDSSLEPYKSKHGFIDTTDLAEQLTSVIKSAKDTVMQSNDRYKKYKQENEALKRRDKLLEKLEEIFQGKIGNPYKSSRLEEIYRQAQLRIELRIPPGWEDEGKHNFKSYGDIVLWFQLIDYARTQKKPIIFVTDDGKKDWWIRDTKGKPTQPLPALIQEMFVETGVLLHMYQGYEFLEKAEHFLNLEEKPEVIADAMAVTEQNSDSVLWRKLDQIRSSLGMYGLAEIFVVEWLHLTFPDHTIQTIITNPNGFPFRIFITPDGFTTRVEIKYKDGSYAIHEIEELFKLSDTRYEGRSFDKFIIVLVSKNIKDAEALAKKIQENINMPSKFSLVVGYVEPGKGFVVSSILP